MTEHHLGQIEQMLDYEMVDEIDSRLEAALL
jgi:hypothetical protein